MVSCERRIVKYDATFEPEALIRIKKTMLWLEKASNRKNLQSIPLIVYLAPIKTKKLGDRKQSGN